MSPPTQGSGTVCNRRTGVPLRKSPRPDPAGQEDDLVATKEWVVAERLIGPVSVDRATAGTRSARWLLLIRPSAMRRTSTSQYARRVALDEIGYGSQQQCRNSSRAVMV